MLHLRQHGTRDVEGGREARDRPALIYVVEGEVTDYASTCVVPIVHRAVKATVETHATAHWWENTGAGLAVLLSADFRSAHGDAHMM